MYRIHFTDDYGPAAFEVNTSEEKDEALDNLRQDPNAENIWVESYNEVEGYWEA